MPREIEIFDQISNATVSMARKRIESSEGDLLVRIDSPGGAVFRGLALFDMIKAVNGKKVCRIESSAFSMAPYVATACDEIEITKNGWIMIHNPRLVEIDGDDEQLAKNAGMLAKLKDNMIAAFVEKTGQPEDVIKDMMKRETFLNAEEALALGFVDRILDQTVASRVDPTAFEKRLPYGAFVALFDGSSGDKTPNGKESPVSESPKEPVAATVKEIKAAFPKMKSDFVLACIELNLPMASVASAAAEELMKENQELQAKLSAMEEELSTLKASAMEEEEPEMEPESEEVPEEEKPVEARYRGVSPQAKSTKPRSANYDPVAEWDSKLKAEADSCGDKQKAVLNLVRKHPQLHRDYLASYNKN